MTQLLVAWCDGDDTAFQRLMPLVHSELRRLAQWHMNGERRDHTLQATALVNEAYVRLIDLNKVRWQNRAHFFAMSARVMRRILVEFARSRGAQKRGAGAARVALDELPDISDEKCAALLALDDALLALQAVDARKGNVVEMRVYGGLSVEETAEVLHVSPETVMRDWKVAKLWLRRELDRR